MTRTPTVYPFQRARTSAGESVLLGGFVIGATFGAVEALTKILEYPDPGEKRYLLGLAVAFYGLAGLTALLVTTVAWRFILRRGRFSRIPVVAGDNALVVGLLVSLMYLVNYYLLPGWRSAISIGANFVFLSLIVVELRVFSERDRPVLPAAIQRLSGALVAVAAALSFMPSGDDSLKSFDRFPLPSSANASARKNILLIVLDTVRADVLELSIDGRPLTPRLRELAAEGTTFTAAFSNAPWTLPSHACLFTGRLPSDHGATMENPFLARGVPTLAELLANVGYATMGISSNGFVSANTGLDRGFERFRLTRGGRPHPWIRFAKRFILPRALHAESWPLIRINPDTGADEIGALAPSWLASKQRNVPYFFFLNFMEAHYPYDPPDAYRPPDITPRSIFCARERDELYSVLTLGGKADRSSLLPTYKLYLAGIRYLDEMVGRLVDRLKKEGRLSNTLVIITADHGECFGEHGLTGHSIGMPDTLLHVPLILWEPGAPKAPRIVTTPVQLIDLFRTVLAAANLELPAGASPDAIDLRGVIPPHPGRALLAERYLPYLPPLSHDLSTRFRNELLSRYNDRIRAIRKDGFKWVRYQKGGRALYRYRTDPEETQDVQKTDRKTASQCNAALESRFPRNLFPAPPSPLEKDEIERQRALIGSLGYAGGKATSRPNE